MTTKENLKTIINNRDLSDILIGDIPVGTVNGIVIKMPYLSGKDIDWINESIVGDKTQYLTPCSRWASMLGTLARAIDSNTLDEVFKFIFSKQQFKSRISSTNIKEIMEIYQQTIKLCVDKINSILFFHDFEATFESGTLRITSTGENLDKYE